MCVHEQTFNLHNNGCEEKKRQIFFVFLFSCECSVFISSDSLMEIEMSYGHRGGIQMIAGLTASVCLVCVRELCMLIPCTHTVYAQCTHIHIAQEMRQCVFCVSPTFDRP